MTRPQTRDEKYNWIYFFGRIRSAASESEYPFALIAAGMESLVTGFGSQASQEEEGRLFGAGINLVFLPLFGPMRF